MVKCLIRIRTKVNVHLRMINHCYRDVQVRVLSLGPRLMGKSLGALPVVPALTEGSSNLDSRTCPRLSVPARRPVSSRRSGSNGGKKERKTTKNNKQTGFQIELKVVTEVAAGGLCWSKFPGSDTDPRGFCSCVSGNISVRGQRELLLWSRSVFCLIHIIF